MGKLLGTFLRKRRMALLSGDPQFTIRKVAGRVGFHHSLLSRIERGETKGLSEANLVRLAETLGLDPDLTLAVAGRVAEDVRRIILERPLVFAGLIRELRTVPDEAIRSHRNLSRCLDEQNERLRRSEEERQQAAAELRIFRQAVDDGPAAIAMADNGGVIRYVNQAFLRLWGFQSPDEIVGHDRSELWAEEQEALKHFREAFASGPRTAELTAKHRKGRRFLVQITASRFLDLDGRVGGLISTFQDITAQRGMERSLRRSNDWLRHFVENMNDVLFTVGTDGIQTYLSPSLESAWGWKPEEIRGRHFAPYVHPEDLSRINEFMRRAVGGRPMVDDFRLRRKSGGYGWARVSVRPSKDVQGRVLSLQGVTMDVTAQHEAELAQAKAKEEAEEANRAKSLFLARMSHEVRSPINAILGLTEMALASPLNGQQQEWLETVHDAAKHLFVVVGDILDLSRIEAHKVSLERVDMDLHHTLRTALRIIEGQARDKGLALNMDIHPDVPRILRGDPARLRQVLINLLNNAVKFTQTGGILVSVEPFGPLPADGDPDPSVRILFSVEDTGMGIAPAAQAEIFKSFTQADESISRRFGGSGLGLSICRNLVRLMRGDIWVESDPGQGSRFSFTVTFDLPSGTQAKGLPTRPEFGLESAPLRVLVVEDDLLNVRVAQSFLLRLGHAPSVVSTGSESLARLAREPFDLVLMDLELPDMSGLEASRLIRQGQAGKSNRDIPVVAMTGHAEARYRQECLSAGMDDFISKPVAFQELSATLARAAARRRQSREHEEAVLDRAGALSRLAGDENLFAEACENLLRELPSRMQRLSQALEREAVGEAVIFSHSLISLCGIVGGTRCQELAKRLEQDLRAGSLNRSLLPRLEREMQALLRALASEVRTRAEVAPQQENRA